MDRQDEEGEDGPWMVVSGRSTRQQQQRSADAGNNISESSRAGQGAWSKRHCQQSSQAVPLSRDEYDHRDTTQYDQHHPAITRYDQHHHVITRSDQHHRAITRYDQHHHVITRSDQHHHAITRYDDVEPDARPFLNKSDLIGAPVVIKESRDAPHGHVGGGGREGEVRGQLGGRGKGRGGLLRVDMQTVMGRRGQQRDKGDRVVVGVTKAENKVDEFDLSMESWPGMVEERGGGGGGGGELSAEKSSVSWTAAVKSMPRPRLPLPTKVHGGDVAGDNIPDSDGEGEDGGSAKKKKKRKKNKSSSSGVAQPLRHTGFTLDLAEILEKVDESSAKTTPHKPMPILSTGPAVPKPHADSLGRGSGTPGHAPNALDSSAPVLRRGKEREQPKKKKPTAMRKVIVKEKEEKKRLRDEGLPIPSDLDVTKVDKEKQEKVGGVIESSNDPVACVDQSSVPVVNETTPHRHNRKFRHYCSHLVTEKLNECVTDLLTDLVRFQDRVYKNEPHKLKIKRRYVCGLREVKKNLQIRLRKIVCVIVPPNLDKIQSTGGIDDHLASILELASQQDIPVVFALTRRRLAWVLKKPHKVGCAAIFSYAGAEDKFHHLMSLVDQARRDYEQNCHPLSLPPSTDQDMSSPSSVEQASGSVSSRDGDGGSSDSSEGEGEDESLLPSTQWNELFSNHYLTKQSNGDVEGGGGDRESATTESKPHFSWNLNAAVFTPHFYPTIPTTQQPGSH